MVGSNLLNKYHLINFRKITVLKKIRIYITHEILGDITFYEFDENNGAVKFQKIHIFGKLLKYIF